MTDTDNLAAPAVVAAICRVVEELEEIAVQLDRLNARLERQPWTLYPLERRR